MNLFVLTDICASGKHCGTCRSLDGGRAWRASLAKAFELPADAPDFACPADRGAKPWGWQRPTKPVEQQKSRKKKAAAPTVSLTDWRAKGPEMWGVLHRWAANINPPFFADVFIKAFTAQIGCGECKTHWLQLLRDDPPDASSAEALFAWTVRVHNAVNRRLGKPEMDLEDARAKWAVHCASSHSFTSTFPINPSHLPKTTID